MIPEVTRQADVFHVLGGTEEGRDFVGIEAGDAATDAGDEEMEFRVFAGKGNELIDVRGDGLYATLHRGDGVALTLQAYALSELSTEFLQRDVSSTAAMHAGKIAAENKDLIFAELRDELGGDTVGSHGT